MEMCITSQFVFPPSTLAATRRDNYYMIIAVTPLLGVSRGNRGKGGGGGESAILVFRKSFEKLGVHFLCIGVVPSHKMVINFPWIYWKLYYTD